MLGLVLTASLFASCFQIHTAVDATFSETDTNCDGRISFEEYRGMVLRHPDLVSLARLPLHLVRSWRHRWHTKGTRHLLHVAYIL